MADNSKALAKKTNLENLVSEGIKLATSQESVNAVAIATFAKTFLNLDDKKAAAIGVGYALLSEHLEKKGPQF